MSKPIIEENPIASASNSPDTQANTAPDDSTGSISTAVVPDGLAAPDGQQPVLPVSHEAPVISEAEAVAQEEDARDAIQNAHPDASLEIDHRRAKQLLDRALLLSERGDLAGAILAARQAVVLTPGSPAGHSMLGLLHERAGDLEKAIVSYEKAVQLAPHSTLERDSLERLKATLTQENSSVLFHFDDNELFEEPDALPTATSGPQGTTPARTAAIVPPAAAAQPAVNAAAVNAQAAPVSAATGAASPASVALAPATQPPAVASPAMPAVSASPPVSASPVMPPLTTPPATSVTIPPAIKPLDFDAPVHRPPLVRALLKQPSFYFKSAPLVATTALGLLFMAWAQGVAQNKLLAEAPRVSSPALTLTPEQKESGMLETPDTTTTTPTTIGVNPAPPPPGTGPGGDILGNGTSSATAQTGRVGSPAPSGSIRATRPATSESRNTSSGTASGGGTAPLPPSAAPPIIPQPAVPGGNGSGSGASGSSPGPFAGLRPITPRSDSAPAVRPGGPAAPVAPPDAPPPASPAASPGDGGGNSRGGGIFNPGTQPRGVIRVDPVRPSGATAPRPANVVRRAEAAAASAAAQGNTGRVIGSMSDSIQRLPTGYAYQRRAMAFLEQGDYSRAADDFQSAISAFEEQIRRGQDVEDARAGVRTCRSGLQMAVANMRRN